MVFATSTKSTGITGTLGEGLTILMLPFSRLATLSRRLFFRACQISVKVCLRYSMSASSPTLSSMSCMWGTGVSRAVRGDYVSPSVFGKCPAFHATNIDVKPSVDVQRLGVNFTVVQHFVSGCGGKLGVLHQRSWISMMSTLWERESDLRRHRRAILLRWAGIQYQRRGEGNRRYLTM